jgi:hypothetical protein
MVQVSVAVENHFFHAGRLRLFGDGLCRPLGFFGTGLWNATAFLSFRLPKLASVWPRSSSITLGVDLRIAAEER